MLNQKYKAIKDIYVTLTRRCNLNCGWCSKGEPQNIDISKEAIDRLLDELHDSFVYCFRPHGGEPFLAEEPFCYLIDQIITRKIRTRKMLVFSNGTIKSDKILHAMLRLLDYLDGQRAVWAEIEPQYFPAFNKCTKSDIQITFSTYDHENKSMQDVADYYRQGSNDRIQIVIEPPDHAVTPDLTGRFKVNAMQYPPEMLQRVRIPYNKYCIINDIDPDIVQMTKAISISARGNIYVGASASHEDADKDYMFSIFDCRNDFWQRVDAWCWQYPLSYEGKRIIENYKAKLWKVEHGIDLNDFERNYIDAFYQIALSIERQSHRLHYDYPQLGHTEIALLAFYCIWCSIFDIYGSSPTEQQLQMLRTVSSAFSGLKINPGEEGQAYAKYAKGIHDLKLINFARNCSKPKTKSNASFTSQYVAQREREKWQRLHKQWAEEGRWDMIEMTLHKLQ